MTFLIYDELSSTNDLAKDLAKNGAAHGTAVLAKRQSNGRGQYDRSWHSPQGGMWLSVILKNIPSAKENRTVMIGAQVKRALEEMTGKSFSIKHPNDILYNNRKVCGILIEMVTKGNYTYGVVGIGLNVNNQQFPPELKDKATSLILIDGIEREIEQVAKQITNCILEEEHVSSN